MLYVYFSYGVYNIFIYFPLLWKKFVHWCVEWILGHLLWGIFRWSSQTLVTRLKSKESGTTYFWPWIGLEFVPTSLWGFCMHKVPIQAWQLTWWPPDSKQVQLLWWMVEFHHLKEDFESIFHPPSSEIVSNFSDTHQSKMKKKKNHITYL